MRFSLLALSLFALAGCSAVSEDDSAQSASADLVAPLWTEAEAASWVVVSHYTAGDVPAGSACVPGTATYVLNTAAASEPGARTIYVTECTGAPARTRQRSVSLTDVEYTAIIGAARSVAFSDKSTCDAGADYVSFGVSPRESGAFPSQYAITDRLGCDWGQSASGIEHVLEIIEPIVAAAPPPAPSVYFGNTPAPGSRVWTAGSRIYLTTGGAGDTPHGSTCARDAAQYIVTVENGEFQDIYVTKCKPWTSDGRLAMLSDFSRPLTAAEKTRLTSALSQLYVSSYASCTPGAEFEQLYVTGKDAIGVEQTTLYTSNDNACVLGSDNAPFVDFAPARDVLSQLTETP
jgi:hypothetical protein